MSNSARPKSLKDQNRSQLWLIIALNAVAFYGISQTDSLLISGFKGLLTEALNLLPLGLAFVITSVANGLLSAKLKERLVFLRWRYALPGHRAFSKFAALDPRIDVERLKTAVGNKMPSDPEDENRMWYRFYKEVEDDPIVQYVHREFLLTRDYTGFAILFLLVFGIASIFMVQSWKISLIYCFLLLLQFVIARQAAATYGIRFVCSVLALKAAKPVTGNS